LQRRQGFDNSITTCLLSVEGSEDDEEREAASRCKLNSIAVGMKGPQSL